MSVTIIKIQIIPVGDKEEIDRVYTYLRNGIYNQYLALNTYMSQLGTLYYNCNRDIKSAEFKEKQREIFLNTNEQIKEIKFPKGLGSTGTWGMKVRSDFSAALKNGLAKGERQLPYYKRNSPLLVDGRFLRFYSKEEEYNKDGEIANRTVYYIKFVNGIIFKVFTGSNKKGSLFLIPLLNNICNNPDKYSVGRSSISINKNRKIILNLTLKIDKKEEKYIPEKNRVMGISFGYDKCITAALSDSDKVYYIGNDIKESIIEKRIKKQEMLQDLQTKLKDAKSGHGYKRKLEKIEKTNKHERNMVNYYNHVLSKEIVEFAKKNKVETIVLENIDINILEKYPVLLRNWSYFQLEEFITYKAEPLIKVVKAKEMDRARTSCCKCGCVFDEKTILPEIIEWTSEVYIECPDCHEKIEYSYNKAKNITIFG